jgi:glycosyltransferase involved in cell wall biosynthesis
MQFCYLSVDYSLGKLMDLSIIVPLYNEYQNVRPLYEAIVKAVNSLELTYEIIFIDDGSKDLTFAEAKKLALEDKRLKIVKFRKNYGQTPAMSAGIEHAIGRILITMDGDLQNDPQDISNFVEKINEGYDVVVGWRYKRQDKLITRKIPSHIANWLIGKVTGVPIRDNGCSLKAYRASIIKEIPLYSEMHRFIPAMSSLAGSKIAEIKVQHHPRKFGVSKYGLSRTFKVLLDLLAIKTIISFSSQPLLWFMILATPPLVVSIALTFTSLYKLVFYSLSISVPIAGTGLLLGALGFFLVLIGIVGELVYRTGDLKITKFSALTSQSSAQSLINHR